MKKNTFIMYAALLALGSCTNEVNEEGFIDKANTISFNAYSSKTRAEDIYQSGDVTISEMQKGSFGVVGYDNSDNRLHLGTSSKATEQFWDDSSNTWEYRDASEMRYWPDGTMDFFAYFPYSDKGATFADTKDDTNPVMTIHCNNDKQDVLFSYIKDRTNTDRVHLFFSHALAKIKSVKIEVNAPEVVVTVSKVEILNSYTKGNINVNSAGVATYSDGNTPRVFEISPVEELRLSTTENPVNGVLFDNSANGYVFPTNATTHESIKGTGQTMWNGTKDALNGGNLSNSKFICMKLTCKVKVHGNYHVGSETDYGVMYIPMRGNNSEGSDISELLAGSRYNYKIVMSGNVGFKDNGEPIVLSYIKFGVNRVYSWGEVDVTINL